jgi:hypothetical protein
MTKRHLSLVPSWLLGCVLFSGTLAAQGEKITLKSAPAPNQVIRIGMTQNISFDAVSAAMPTGAMKIEGVTSFQGTQRVGAPDAQGRITAEFHIDSMTIGMTLNGNALPSPPLDSLKGKSFTLTYDAAGKVVDFKATGEMEAAMNSVKTMMGQLSSNLPNATLAIGDTISVPVSLAIPVPGLGSSGEPINLQGSNTFKLVALGRDGSDRLATLELRTEAAMSGNLNLHMTGTGSMQWNVDKGFLKAGSNDLKMEMTMTMPGGGGGGGGTMTLNGTIHMVITGESRAP